MLTRERLREEMLESERLEGQIYMELTLDLLNRLQAPLRDLYDTMVTATQGLRAISAEAILSHPGIVKMLRYTTAPTISQMRLGQIAGLRTTADFEEKGIRPSPEQAERLALWFREHLDQERFLWLADDDLQRPTAELGVAERYAKLWTVSLIANQNTATAYRNRRKARQEEAIANALRHVGFAEQRKLGLPLTQGRARRRELPPAQTRKPGGISKVEDVQPGHFVREQKLLFGKNQKADLTARPEADNRLICIEAKAVGIRIDSTKRLKELNDKHTDWINSGLDIITIGVCAGFFNDIELIATARGRGIPIFWERNLDQLIAFVREGIYYGSVWKPNELFPDIPTAAIQAELESIKATSRSIAEAGEEYTTESEPSES
ncbi:MAG: XamI family restriction endonuclease [Roseiflexaceae bacterium]